MKKEPFEYVPNPLWGEHQDEERPNSVQDNIFCMNLTEAYKKIIDNGFTSTGKNKEVTLHDLIRNIIEPRLDKERYIAISKTANGDNNCEYNVNILGGNGKKIDIVIIDKKYNKVVLGINCKFPLASLGKNTPNYMDGLSGESYRLHKANPDIPFFSFNVFVSETPVFNKDKDITRFDTTTQEHIDNFDDLAKGIVTEDKFLRCFGLFVVNDPKINDKIKTLYDFIQVHQDQFMLEYFSKKTYNNMIYNDIQKFIQEILDCIENYDKNN